MGIRAPDGQADFHSNAEGTSLGDGVFVEDAGMGIADVGREESHPETSV